MQKNRTADLHLHLHSWFLIAKRPKWQLPCLSSRNRRGRPSGRGRTTTSRGRPSKKSEEHEILDEQIMKELVRDKAWDTYWLSLGCPCPSSSSMSLLKAYSISCIPFSTSCCVLASPTSQSLTHVNISTVLGSNRRRRSSITLLVGQDSEEIVETISLENMDKMRCKFVLMPPT